ncbi:HNH endonuclease [Aromatoleum anaerobium]|nr:HNH endonuclease signature motif containing protein [Aromatoleum anaerobium]MCK0507912.1 HNH endonuclease [Aromatoleum anaerobium]
MGTSKLQRERVVVTCACGCGETFSAFPTYRSKAEGGGLRVPEYKRGHHPNCRKSQTGRAEPWNKGMKKADHPSIERMGFQPGHAPHNDWSHVNELLRSNIEVRKKWLEHKRGQVAWNTGLSREQYPNGIASGAGHGNWKGGHRGTVDTAEWQRLRRETLVRDNYTCQECGDKNRQGRGSRIQLEVHHIIALCEDPSLALDPDNLITLCRSCHYKTHNYGSKAVKRRGS